MKKGPSLVEGVCASALSADSAWFSLVRSGWLLRCPGGEKRLCSVGSQKWNQKLLLLGHADEGRVQRLMVYVQILAGGLFQSHCVNVRQV